MYARADFSGCGVRVVAAPTHSSPSSTLRVYVCTPSFSPLIRRVDCALRRLMRRVAMLASLAACSSSCHFCWPKACPLARREARRGLHTLHCNCIRLSLTTGHDSVSRTCFGGRNMSQPSTIAATAFVYAALRLTHPPFLFPLHPAHRHTPGYTSRLPRSRALCLSFHLCYITSIQR